MKKRRLLLSWSALALSLLVLAGVCYAWFAGGTSTVEHFVIKTAKIEIETHLCRVRDGNWDGNCDLDADGNFLCEPESEDHSVAVPKMFPGKTVTFLLTVENRGSSTSRLNVSLDVDAATAPDGLPPVNRLYAVYYADASAAYESTDLAPRRTVLSKGVGEGTNELEFGDAPLTVEPQTTVSFYFSVRFLTVAELPAEDAALFAGADLSVYREQTCRFTLNAELAQYAAPNP